MSAALRPAKSLGKTFGVPGGLVEGGAVPLVIRPQAFL
ncbi:hypothetical protein TRICHSKD4_1688 [Roseibium sp. TrichSKD4]|nr:hypothetical protein TRICHSKD4_1688 [Roseibium sp. TrichSKD4]